MRPLPPTALALRGLKVLVLNTVIALGITLFDNHSFGLNLLYSLEGALVGCHWQEIPEARRQQLVAVRRQ